MRAKAAPLMALGDHTPGGGTERLTSNLELKTVLVFTRSKEYAF